MGHLGLCGPNLGWVLLLGLAELAVAGWPTSGAGWDRRGPPVWDLFTESRFQFIRYNYLARRYSFVLAARMGVATF